MITHFQNRALPFVALSAKAQQACPSVGIGPTSASESFPVAVTGLAPFFGLSAPWLRIPLSEILRDLDSLDEVFDYVFTQTPDRGR